MEITSTLIHIPLNSIKISSLQSRLDYDPEKLQELAQSIKSVGIIHPPLVKRGNDSETYELIAGHRRILAAKLAGLKEVPVILSSVQDPSQAASTLIENIQRENLNPIEIAKGLQLLIEQIGYTQEKLASIIGKKRSSITNYLRLLNLPTSIQKSLIKQWITMGHAKAILSLSSEKLQKILHDAILRDSLSVREAEKRAKKLQTSIEIQKQPSTSLEKVNHKNNLILKDLALKFQEALGSQVTIEGSQNKGKIIITYYNLEDIDRLCDLIIKKE